jgi:predicted ATPase/DNA-binding winged helix-turn-helix (wHTH) protein
MHASTISFGPYRLLAAQRLLLEGDKPVRLGSRAFDILAALVERAGEVVGKEELRARAWPETFVEESNLTIQVSALRRALGDGQGGHRYVVTVPGRGYNFVAPVRLVAPVSREESPQAPLPPTIAPARGHNLPLAVTRLIGRDETVTALVSRLSRQRLVTIVGPGGIGKTTLALAVAERMIASYEHGIWLVDLAPLGDPRLVSSAAATVLGLEMRTEDPLPGLVASLRDKRMLLLLDNCEHVIDAAASLAAAVLSGAPGVNVLATSREPLGVAGGRQYRLGPLSSPEPSSRLTAAEAEVFPAVQLFVERVTAIVEDFALTDANAPLVVEICRRLDGLPLAIEFAAPRVEALGVEGLAARLDDSLPLLGAPRRTALPRHRTMRAVVDWSYGLLSEDEQLFFRALGIFTGVFTVEAAAAVATDAANAGVDALGRLADLVAKSLVVADVSDTEPRFRLLDTTRAYAIEKLDESGEREPLARRHAEHYRDLFERAEAEWETRPANEWLAAYAFRLDDVRAALDWALSPGGDAEIGVALTIAAAPLWFQLSLINECQTRVEHALRTLNPAPGEGGRRTMRLYAALGCSEMFTTGPTRKIATGWTTALELAEGLGDTDYQLRALWGLWAGRMNNGDFHAALELARRFHDVSARSAGLPIGDRMFAAALHFLGDQGGARQHIERMLARYVAPASRSHIIRFQFDQGVTARITLARVLWLQGFPDQALRCVEDNIKHALSLDHVLSLCNALAQAACPVALLAGELAAAERFTALLLHHTRDHALDLWNAYGRLFRGAILVRRGEVESGLPLLRDAVGELGEASEQYRTAFLGELANGEARAGETDAAMAAVDEALACSERTGEGWYVAELRRTRGELLLLGGTADTASAAEEEFRVSIETAQAQGALSWELRGATSLAHLQQQHGHVARARSLLAPVYGRFTEGFDTADLIEAKQLLDELGDAGRR